MKEKPRLIKEAIKELNNEGFLLAKHSIGETHVSLGAHRIQEIKTHIAKWLGIPDIL